MSFRRHVNGLEFCYRTLVDHLGLAAANIQVLNFNGSSRAFGETEGESCGLWPGDNTPYRLVVNGEGSRGAFQHALRAVSGKLSPDDQLFINITGHGGHHGDGRGPDLVIYPHCERYKRRDFCADLATLPPHRSLVVLMAQCFSGGFNQAVIDASRAELTFIAAATSETRQSFMVLDDPNWDSFQRNWIAGLAGHDVDGAPIPGSIGHCGGGPVSVYQAFQYASAYSTSNPYDSPQFAARPLSACDLTLRD